MEQAGVSLWRQVSKALTEEIEDGRLKANERLPTAELLAARFSVNRHTVLKAIQHLQSEGLVHTERGRGSYAVVNPTELRLGARNWFEQDLRESSRTSARTILAIKELSASREVANALKLDVGAPVFFVTSLGEADGVPVNFVYHYYPLKRIPGIARAFEQVGSGPIKDLSLTDLLKSAGVEDPRRKSVRINSRSPTREEAQALKIPAAGHLLVTQIVQIDADYQPVVYAEACYGAGRVSLIIDLDPNSSV